MKTKFIKVATADRLPDEAGNYDTELGKKSYSKSMKLFIDDDGEEIYPEYWLEEKPDYEEGMKEMLERIRKDLDNEGLICWLTPDVDSDLENLLTKLKTES